MVVVKYFGMVQEWTGKDSEKITYLQDQKVGDLLNELSKNYAFPKDVVLKVAVNQQIVPNDFVITEGVEVALLPPFAGG